MFQHSTLYFKLLFAIVTTKLNSFEQKVTYSTQRPNCQKGHCTTLLPMHPSPHGPLLLPFRCTLVLMDYLLLPLMHPGPWTIITLPHNGLWSS